MKQAPLILFLLLATAVLLSNCTQSGPCEGSLTLENPLPDTTVAVGDTLFIDLTDPPVFVSSEGEVTYDYSIESGVTNSNMNLIGNKGSILTITGRAVGKLFWN
jgi:hypothetical protein